MDTSAHARVLALDEADEAEFMLPPPTPAFAVTAKDRRPHTRLVAVGGRKFIVDVTAARELVAYVFGCCWAGRNRKADAPRMRMGRRRTRLLRAFVADVAAVAWPPVVIFVSMMWWFL